MCNRISVGISEVKTRTSSKLARGVPLSEVPDLALNVIVRSDFGPMPRQMRRVARVRKSTTSCRDANPRKTSATPATMLIVNSFNMNGTRGIQGEFSQIRLPGDETFPNSFLFSEGYGNDQVSARYSLVAVPARVVSLNGSDDQHSTRPTSRCHRRGESGSCCPGSGNRLARRGDKFAYEDRPVVSAVGASANLLIRSHTGCPGLSLVIGSRSEDAHGRP